MVPHDDQVAAGPCPPEGRRTPAGIARDGRVQRIAHDIPHLVLGDIVLDYDVDVIAVLIVLQIPMGSTSASTALGGQIPARLDL
jgi:hypothetical protein